ncbi:MAG TPA: MBL fold metallo-hydrolase [Pyrinomonadaceae bacterium]|jgi:flavorubredoxin
MNITEIASDVYRFSTFVPEINLQFNQFLVKDDEPLLFHTGMKALFPLVREAVAKVVNPKDLRWIGFSHFEADECGSLNEWLEIAPNAAPVCSLVGALVSVNDYAIRPAKGLTDGETFSTGKFNFRLVHTPHLPHCWEASTLFEERTGTLFCSDLFHQNGDAKAYTDSDIMGNVRESMIAMQSSPLNDYMPYTTRTETNLQKLAALNPQTIVPMHGSAFTGDGKQALQDFGIIMREVLTA